MAEVAIYAYDIPNVNGRISNRRNARAVKALALLYLGLTVAALLLVHGSVYEPAVALVPLYFAVSIGVTSSVALLLLPTDQFSVGFCVGVYALLAAFVGMMVFFSGGVSSELYVMYFPLLLVGALHGSRRIGLGALVFVLIFYFLATLPDLLSGDAEAPALTMFRLVVFALVGVFVVAAQGASEGEEEDAVSEDGSSVLLDQVSGELNARRGVPVAVILVDPGRDPEDLDLLLDRVRSRIADPVLLGEGAVFGIVLSGVDDRAVESAARRALAAASSLGSPETRAGAAIYPRDARSAEDLLVAAGRALEAAFEIESPSAIVLAGRGTPRPESPYRAAR